MHYVAQTQFNGDHIYRNNQSGPNLRNVVFSALSHLVCASYTEDTYGVVQKSLAEIISMMLSLQEASQLLHNTHVVA